MKCICKKHNHNIGFYVDVVYNYSKEYIPSTPDDWPYWKYEVDIGDENIFIFNERLFNESFIEMDEYRENIINEILK